MSISYVSSAPIAPKPYHEQHAGYYRPVRTDPFEPWRASPVLDKPRPAPYFYVKFSLRDVPKGWCHGIGTTVGVGVAGGAETGNARQDGLGTGSEGREGASNERRGAMKRKKKKNVKITNVLKNILRPNPRAGLSSPFSPYFLASPSYLPLPEHEPDYEQLYFELLQERNFERSQLELSEREPEPVPLRDWKAWGYFSCPTIDGITVRNYRTPSFSSITSSKLTTLPVISTPPGSPSTIPSPTRSFPQPRL
jgi:hypothetical protein